jgi:hypothetical protein
MTTRSRLAAVAPILLVVCSPSLRPAPPAVQAPATAAPASAELRQPVLGPPAAPAPASLEAFLDAGAPARGPFSRFHAATARIAGARVRWRLWSWGGEVSDVGFDTPTGRPPATVGRIRFVSELLQGADLSGVYDAGSLRATGVIQGDPFEQVWLAGGVCPDCGGGLGPSGERPCDAPYLGP